MKQSTSASRLLSVLILLFFTLPDFGSLAQETTVTLTILHTNDTHGQLLPFELDLKTVGGIARRATIVSQIRKENPRRVLLLEAGDLLSLKQGMFSRGGPLILADGGRGYFGLLNDLGYDAVVPGNGDYYYGVGNLLNLRKHAKFPIIEANIIDRLTSSPLHTPYFIKDVNGLQIGILGLGYIHSNHPSCRPLELQNAVDIAKKYAPMLREKCELVIALTHIGHSEDVLLAANVPEIDLVVGGHSHTFVPEPVEIKRPGHTSAWVAQAGDMGRYLGRVDIQLNNHSGCYRMIRAKGRLIPVDAETAPDAKIEKAVAALQKPLRKVICTAEVALPNPPTDPSPMRDFILSAMRQATEADIALLDRGAVQEGLKAGPIYLEDVYRVHVWRNSLLMLSLTADQIRSILAEPEAVSAGCEFRRNGKVIEDLSIGGYLAVADRAYTVAIGSFLLGYFPDLSIVKATDTGERIDTVLEKALRHHKVITRKTQFTQLAVPAAP